MKTFLKKASLVFAVLVLSVFIAGCNPQQQGNTTDDTGTSATQPSVDTTTDTSGNTVDTADDTANTDAAVNGGTNAADGTTGDTTTAN